MEAVLFALNAAFMFALGTQFSKRGLAYADAATGVVIQLCVQAALYWAFAPFFIEAHYWLMPVALLFAAIGFFRPFLSSRMAIVGNRHMGPTITSAVASTSPLFGVILGVAVLGETLHPSVAMGAAGIFAGIALLSWPRGEIKRDWPLWVIFLPMGAAFLRSFGNLIAKIGMETLASPFFASLVAASVAAVLALVTNAKKIDTVALKGQGTKWFVLCGACYATGALSVNLALIRGQLVEVSLILACVPLFSLFLGIFIFREKAITLQVAVAVVLIVAGVMGVSVSR